MKLYKPASDDVNMLRRYYEWHELVRACIMSGLTQRSGPGAKIKNINADIVISVDDVIWEHILPNKRKINQITTNSTQNEPRASGAAEGHGYR